MSKTLLLTMAMMLCASLALAQAGSIGVFADAGATDCDLLDTELPQNVYVVHTFSSGATKAKFKVVVSAGVNWTSFGGFVPGPTSPNPITPFTAIEINYNECGISPRVILQLFYGVPQGAPSATCSTIKVAPADGETDILVWDCTDPVPQALVATGGTLIVNPDASCNCTVPVEDTTWGGLKALFLVE